jgi:hypothetical protein
MLKKISPAAFLSPSLFLHGLKLSLHPLYKSNCSRWSKFHPLFEVIGGGVKIFSSLKHNLLQQFPYFPSQLVGPTMPHHLLLPSPKSCICSVVEAGGRIEWVPLIGGGGEVPFIKGMEREF